MKKKKKETGKHLATFASFRSLFSLSFRFIDDGIREIYRPSGMINSTEKLRDGFRNEEHRVHSRFIPKGPSGNVRRT